MKEFENASEKRKAQIQSEFESLEKKAEKSIENLKNELNNI